MAVRGLDNRFLAAMRYKLKKGREAGYDGWDLRWKNLWFGSTPRGTTGYMMRRLSEEMLELAEAVAKGDTKAIREEAADVANFAMMVADIHDSL